MKKSPDESAAKGQKKILVFAHVPPPLHGQSKMVERDLKALRESFPGRVLHLDAQWSNSLEDIGGIGIRKIGRIFIFVWKAFMARFRDGAEILYYVPGPVKPSAVVRDFIVLSILRPFFSATVFHWHAIGQGEWAHGSERVKLTDRRWLDSLMRSLGAWSLADPELSIVVSKASDRDARAVSSQAVAVVPNGLSDPVGKEESVPARGREPKRLLFFSRGTEEKGILDALKAVSLCASENSLEGRGYSLTLAGGVDAGVESQVAALSEDCRSSGIPIERRDFLTGREKDELFRTHDLLIFSSHWESFGLVVTEAMALDLPVIATTSDGVLGILGEDYPYLAPVGDPRRLSDVLTGILLNGLEETRGRELFLESFQLESHQSSFIESLREVM
jgi:glycosyltransferase involved in cell wall biosynthesis